MFPPQTSLCPEAHAHLIPKDAQTLIELSEEGMGPDSGSDKYFYLGYTADRGVAVSVVGEPWKRQESHCDLPMTDRPIRIALPKVDLNSRVDTFPPMPARRRMKIRLVDINTEVVTGWKFAS